ncbi:hypothetical protein BDP27DRAFT_1506647 [Rhodocollybia butyracea]|uniref:Uncharacterized protein n=1 Tax=Rhodocollybia butyracea TaxID=206335 RepID=A0A9P5PZ59_9AGAR|nr:hypothetical protein BDP27DRAFT_1506647 [Rhodocollybia butyracea]
MKGFQSYPSLGRADRPRKTHKTEEIIALYKKLDIGLRLKLNFRIDKENRKRREKSLEFQLGQAEEDASDIASFVSIATKSLENIRKDPTIFERLKDWLTTETLSFFRLRNEEEEGERHGGRTRDRDEVGERPKKKRKTEKVVLIPRSAGPREIVFDALLYDTIDAFPVFPLFLFTNKNLELINTHMPELKRAKISHIEGKPHVLDLKEIAKWIKEAGGPYCDNQLDFIQWSQAAKNFYNFECSRDEELGKDAPRPLFYVDHFAFFLNQQDSEDYFSYWLNVEIRLRKDHQSKLYAFDIDTYGKEWTLVRAERAADVKYFPLPSLTFSGPSKTQPPKAPALLSVVQTASSLTTQKPFSQGSKEKTAAPCCLGCATRGHKLDAHDDTKHGPFRWAQNIRGVISTPGGKSICWYWNLQGRCRGCDKEHCCTFCGSSSHYAFKWECLTQPSLV